MKVYVLYVCLIPEGQKSKVEYQVMKRRKQFQIFKTNSIKHNVIHINCTCYLYTFVPWGRRGRDRMVHVLFLLPMQ